MYIYYRESSLASEQCFVSDVWLIILSCLIPHGVILHWCSDDTVLLSTAVILYYILVYLINIREYACLLWSVHIMTHSFNTPESDEVGQYHPDRSWQSSLAFGATACRLYNLSTGVQVSSPAHRSVSCVDDQSGFGTSPFVVKMTTASSVSSKLKCMDVGIREGRGRDG